MASYHLAYHRVGEKRRLSETMDVDSDSTNEMSTPSKPGGDQEKKLRREIANSNERRRMQSINAGFQSLKTLIPHHDGEKLSKAAILMQTTDHIAGLEHEKERLLSQNAQLKAILRDLGCLDEAEFSLHRVSPPKRKKRDTESSDEGISLSCSDLAEESMEDLKREVVDLRLELDRERRGRMLLEEQVRQTEQGMQEETSKPTVETWPNDEVKPGSKEMEEDIKVIKEEPDTVESDESSTEVPKQVSTTQTQQARNSTLFNNYLSRKNLETIVEAIRHLEGDALPLECMDVNQADSRIPSEDKACDEITFDIDNSTPQGPCWECPSQPGVRTDGEVIDKAIVVERKPAHDICHVAASAVSNVHPSPQVTSPLQTS